MNPKKYVKADLHVVVEPNPNGRFYVPKKNRVYILTIDRLRRFQAFKDAALKVLLNLAESMAN